MQNKLISVACLKCSKKKNNSQESPPPLLENGGTEVAKEGSSALQKAKQVELALFIVFANVVGLKETKKDSTRQLRTQESYPDAAN